MTNLPPRPVPAGLKNAGYFTADTVRVRRRLMIGTDGLTNAGKTEFLLSVPGHKVLIILDRSFDSALDNPYPPESRILDDTWFDVIKVPTLGQAKQDDFLKYWQDFRTRLYKAIEIPEVNCVAIDGDSDSWEIQLLAEFGKVSQIPPMAYQMVDGVRRGLINRCWDSGKIIIGTNKLKDKYENVLDENGNEIIDEKSKKPKQRKVEGEYKRQGFRDQNYLYQLQLRHLYRPPEKSEEKTILVGPRKGQKIGGIKPAQWGIRIMKCKVNTRLEGDELWGDQCNFAGLVQHVYPQVPLEEWGF